MHYSRGSPYLQKTQANERDRFEKGIWDRPQLKARIWQKLLHSRKTKMYFITGWTWKYKDYIWVGQDFILTVDRAVVDSHTKICAVLIRDLSTLDQSALRVRGPAKFELIYRLLYHLWKCLGKKRAPKRKKQNNWRGETWWWNPRASVVLNLLMISFSVCWFASAQFLSYNRSK